MQERPSPEQVKKTLLSQSQMVHPDESEILFPMTERVLVNLPVAEIDACDKDTSRAESPNFSKIKESISKYGLNQPFVITCRPEQNRFVVYKGRNTRLKAISERYEETGDQRYRYVDCLFKLLYPPIWQSWKFALSHPLTKRSRPAQLNRVIALCVSVSSKS